MMGDLVNESEKGVQILRNMADEALLHLLKMRRSRSRMGGLPGLADLVGPYLRGGQALERCFPKTLAYFRLVRTAVVRVTHGTINNESGVLRLAGIYLNSQIR